MAAHIIHAFPAAATRSARFSTQRAWAVVCTMYRARQTRRMLGDMDPRLLADIGASPADAHMEAARPFWDVSSRVR